MKKIFCLLFTVFTICLASHAEAKNENSSFAKQIPKLQSGTTAFLNKYIKDNFPNCKGDITIIETKTTKKPYNKQYKNGKGVGAQWDELWTVNACSTTFYIPIKFKLTDGNIDLFIEPGSAYGIPQNNKQ